jgi:hypothetical protein
MFRLSAATILLAVTATYASAADQANACLTAAFTAYNNANVGLIAEAGIPMKAEGQIAQRRLQEQYCARVAQCKIATLPPQQTTIAFDVAFSYCLRDEAMEKYELTPSKGN